MKRLFLFVLIIIMLAACMPFCLSASEETVTAAAHTNIITGDIITWDVSFDFDLFFGNPDEYDHGLAEMSLGMAVSAFRNNESEEKDEWIRQYLTEAGFEEHRSEGYDLPTGEHTVSTYIASKELDDITIIAAVDCGGGYGNEWLSNFNVGTGNRHEGFNEAAMEFESRLLQYIADKGIEGRIILWMAGYSRGAAIANIVEADMTDSGLFEKVFGYNFAVPRTTKNPGTYTNIFNILGKYDPVTMIPLPEWGYKRYGTDIFTPAQEMDSDYKTLAIGANEVSTALTGKRFSNNPGVNSQLHMVLEYLLQMMPKDSDYEKSLKEPIKAAMVKHDVDSLLLVLSDALENIGSLDASGQAAAANLLTYLETILSNYLRGNKSDVENGYWDVSDSMASNIMHEHSPEVYIEWIKGISDQALLLNNCSSTRRFVITGNVSVEIHDDNGYIQSIDNKGDSYIDRELSDGSYTSPVIYAVRQGSQTIMSLPGDKAYSIFIHAHKSEAAGYMETIYRVNSIEGETLPIVGFNAKKNKDYCLKVSLDNKTLLVNSQGKNVSVWKTEGGYSPSIISQIENVNVFHFSITGAIIVIAGVIAFVVLLIVIVIVLAIVHGINCRRRGRPYSKYCVIVPHLLFVLLFYLLAEGTGYIMPVIRILPPLFASLGTATMLVIAIRGGLRRSCLRNTVIIAILAVMTAGVFFLFYYTGVGVVDWFQFIMMGLYFMVFSILAVYTFPHEGKIRIKGEKNA